MTQLPAPKIPERDYPFSFTEEDKQKITKAWRKTFCKGPYCTTPYEWECIRLLTKLTRPERDALFQWEYCELELSFLGFLDKYADIPQKIPKGTTVIDFGCNQAIQAAYFQDFHYIGVDCAVPIENRLNRAYTTHFDMRIQDFIKDNPLGLNFKKCVAICSYVPDQEAERMIMERFPYARVVYCNEVKKDTVSNIRKQIKLDKQRGE